MASSPVVALPTEIRDLINSPHHHSPITRRGSIMPQHTPTSSRRNSIIMPTATPTSSRRNSLAQPAPQPTQQPSSHSLLLRRAALTPGTKTSALIYNLDFREMTTFIRSLRPAEIATINKYQSLVLNLVIFNLRGQGVQRLLEWVELCEAVGLKGLEYRVQWTQFDLAAVEAVQGCLGRYREGEKILRRLVGGKTLRGRRS